MFADVYRGKRVLVTGHTGFKGSWLCLWLKMLGAEVTGYSLDVPTDPAHFDLLSLDMDDRRGDILDFESVRGVVREVRPHAVFHMAAQPLVRLSYREPLPTLAVNVMGTAHLLEACRGVDPIAAIINVTSDKCYENVGKATGYVETDAMGGHDPYSASKGCAELVAASYRRAFADLPPMASVRAGNVIGGGDWAADRLIPDMARAVAAGEEVVIRRPDAVRPWQYVLEPLSGYLLLGQKLLQGDQTVTGGWNFGPDPECVLTVGDVLLRLHPLMGLRYRIDQAQADLHEATLLTLDSTKAHKVLDWRPVWSAEAMLEKTAQWYGAFIHDKKLLSTQQLQAFAADARAKGMAWAS